jgi:hypothetical protein
MRFNVDRICELAGLGAASGGLLSEAAAPAMGKPAAPAAGAKAPPMPPMAAKKPMAPAPAAKPGAAPIAPKMEEEDEGYYMEEGEYEGHYMEGEDEGYHMEEMGGMIDDDEMYEIDEMSLMEALVDMRQRRLEEATVRETVQDEIRRALSDKSGSWVYGANKPGASRVGQVARGGFGVGFKR